MLCFTENSSLTRDQKVNVGIRYECYYYALLKNANVSGICKVSFLLDAFISFSLLIIYVHKNNTSIFDYSILTHKEFCTMLFVLERSNKQNPSKRMCNKAQKKHICMLIMDDIYWLFIKTQTVLYASYAINFFKY